MSAVPDPHLLYKRIDPWIEDDQIADGPVLLVGSDGIIMISTGSAESDRSADTPDATIFRFPSLRELRHDVLRRLYEAAKSTPLHQIATAGGAPVYAVGVGGIDEPTSGTHGDQSPR